MAKNDKSYHAQKDKEQIKKLDELLTELPKFCKTFFRGIEQTTSSSTRLGYAYDLRIFFNFIKEYASCSVNHNNILLTFLLNYSNKTIYLNFIFSSLFF